MFFTTLLMATLGSAQSMTLTQVLEANNKTLSTLNSKRRDRKKEEC